MRDITSQSLGLQKQTNKIVGVMVSMAVGRRVQSPRTKPLPSFAQSGPFEMLDFSRHREHRKLKSKKYR